MLHRGGWLTLPSVYLPPFGHFGIPPLRYFATSDSTTGSSDGILFSNAHCSLAPSSWRRLLMQAFRGLAHRSPTKSGMMTKTVAMTNAQIIPSLHQNLLRFFGTPALPIKNRRDEMVAVESQTEHTFAVCLAKEDDISALRREELFWRHENITTF